MKRTIEVEMNSRTNNVAKAIDKFFTKHPELDYWKEEFEWMAENKKYFECNDRMADGTKNEDWTYALHLDINEDTVYMCVIERA